MFIKIRAYIIYEPKSESGNLKLKIISPRGLYAVLLHLFGPLAQLSEDRN